MIYYTQLIFLHRGREKEFLEFEDHVLPMLAKYDGKLLYRVRPSEEDIISSETGTPYEVHLVSFPARTNFDAYASDPVRQKYLHLKNDSISRVLLIEGHVV